MRILSLINGQALDRAKLLIHDPPNLPLSCESLKPWIISPYVKSYCHEAAMSFGVAGGVYPSSSPHKDPRECSWRSFCNHSGMYSRHWRSWQAVYVCCRMPTRLVHQMRTYCWRENTLFAVGLSLMLFILIWVCNVVDGSRGWSMVFDGLALWKGVWESVWDGI